MGYLAAHARPVGERRPGDKDRAGQIGRHRRHHHDLPARLTVSDQHGLAVRVLVPLGDDANEMRLRAADVRDRLARLRLWQKADEIARMARAQRDADLAVMLHPANARAVAGARVEDNEWPLMRVDRDVGRRNDFHQGVIDGRRQRTAVDKKLELEVQHMWRCSIALLQIVISPAAQYVEEEDGALEGVLQVVEKRGRERSGLEHNCSFNWRSVRRLGL